MPASLSYSGSDGTKQTVFLIPDGCAIGRRPSKHLLCFSSEHVSSGRAWIELRGRAWWLSGAGSAHGTGARLHLVVTGEVRARSAVAMSCAVAASRFDLK